MILLCSRCGAELPTQFRGEWWRTDDQCADCGVASDDTPPRLPPSDDEVAYALEGWPAVGRTAVTVSLVRDGIPYRWEEDLVLAVPMVYEAEVDRLLAEAGAEEVPFDVDDLAADEDDAGDGGEEAHAAMTDLFVAADRLRRAPDELDVVDELAGLAEVVNASAPPFGIELQVWQRVQTLATAAVAATSGSDDDAVIASATELREFLRPYV